MSAALRRAAAAALVACTLPGVPAAAQREPETPVARHALVVGVSRYPRSPDADLRFAADDAREFARFLGTDSGGAFQVTLLRDRQATREAILSAVAALGRRAGPADVVYVFFSGHGVRDARQDVYLMPSDASLDAPEVQGIRAGDLVTRVVDGVHAAAVVFFLDACYAGAGEVGMKSRPGDLVTQLNALWEREMSRLGGDGVAFAFYSASARQPSLEDGEHRQGLFTHYLLRGMRGAADGATRTPKDGVVQADELHRYLAAEVGGRSRGRWGMAQDPTVSPRMVGSFPISAYASAPPPGGRAPGGPEVDAPAAAPPAPRVRRRPDGTIRQTLATGAAHATRRRWRPALASYRAAAEAANAYDSANPGSAWSVSDARVAAVRGAVEAAYGMTQAGDLTGADSAFAWLVRYAPESEDAARGRALVLAARGRWEPAVPALAAALRMEPLNDSLLRVLLRAHESLARQAQDPAERARWTRLADEAAETSRALPVAMGPLQMELGEGGVRVSGTFVGIAARRGTPLRLRFHLATPGRALPPVEVEVRAPEPGTWRAFRTPVVPTVLTPTGVRYELVPPPGSERAAPPPTAPAGPPAPAR
jgi:tetratricopeptide (TPR) repeat protein